MNLGARIKAARTHARLTQAQLGKRVGMTQQMIQKLEAGGADATAALLDICIETGVSPRWLARYEGEMLPPTGGGDASQATGLDSDLLAIAGDVAEAIAGRKVDPRTDAKLIALAYSKIAQLTGKPIPAAVIVDITHQAQEWGYGKARVSGQGQSRRARSD